MAGASEDEVTLLFLFSPRPRMSGTLGGIPPGVRYQRSRYLSPELHQARRSTAERATQ
jgi:hypothetical protein